MQLVVQHLSHFATEHVHEVLRRRLLHTQHAAETLDEKTPAFLADAREVVELAVKGPLRPSPAMRRHREAVCLVPHHLQKLQRRVMAIETDRLPAITKLNLILTLCETRERQ